MTAEFALEMRGITKTFSGMTALDRVSLRVRPGQVMALMGESGAGKSTLLKVLTGIHRPDSGSIFLAGRQRHFDGPHEALGAGVAIVHQEPTAVTGMSVAENVFLGHERTVGGPWSPVVDLAGMRRATGEIFDEIGIDIDPSHPMSTLGPAQRRLVEIARALATEARVIVLDEPASSMTEADTELLFTQIRRLSARGISFVYASHRMEEVFEIAQAITVLRDGVLVGEFPTADLTPDALIRLMTNREVGSLFPERVHEAGEVVLELERVTSDHVFGVSLQVRAGEVLGLTGLMGAGCCDLVETVCGLHQLQSGRVWLGGRALSIRHPADAIAAGIALVTRDRVRTGLNLAGSLRENVTMVTLPRYARGGIVDWQAQQKAALDSVNRLGITTPSVTTTVMDLSGADQQKVVLGKWLLATPRVIILDEPTRGIGIDATQEVYALINALAAEGVAVILISSAIAELMGMADRITVMREGRVTGVLDRAEFTPETIMLLASEHVSAATGAGVP